MVAYVMAVNGLRPQFGATDTDKFLWAQSWAQWGTKLSVPRVGCVMVLTREGGGHVTLYEEDAGSSFKGRGGNQSDAVNVASFTDSSIIAMVWPNEGPTPPPPPGPESLPMLEEGDVGAAVVEAQIMLGEIEVDGIFGPETERATVQFQQMHGLERDGVIGPDTWTALLATRSPEDDLPKELILDICAKANNSPIAKYSWRDRGRAPAGFTNGLAVTFAYVYRQWLAGDEAARAMAVKAGNPDTDALAFYDAEFRALGMSNATAGVDTLRHLFVMLYGLGMRESSGKHCEGRDTSASNTSSETAEAGLFQTSWNARNAHPQMRVLFDEYDNQPNETGFLEVFFEGVSCSSSSWTNYGSGEGHRYQQMSKTCPAFHVEFTAIGLRNLRKHWGPIGRKEVEIRGEADTLLRDVQALVDTFAPEPEPIPPEPGEVVSSAELANELLAAMRPRIIEVLDEYVITRETEPVS
jgi:peptidoglycan hydrolase-like protein with peptidoglycan-binding domain